MRLFAKSPMEMRRQAEKEQGKEKASAARKQEARRPDARRGTPGRVDSPAPDAEQQQDCEAAWLAYLRNGDGAIK